MTTPPRLDATNAAANAAAVADAAPTAPAAVALATHPEGEGEGQETDIRRIIKQMVWTILGLVVLVGGGIIAFRGPLERLSQWFVMHLGGVGVALGHFLPDALAAPLPNDAFSFFGLAGGMSFWEVVAWSSLGTLVGGAVGFWIGRKLQHTRWFKALMRKRGRQVNALFRRYGVVALVIAALTPIPYWLGCWISGAGGMRFRLFLTLSTLRVPKVIFYLWLIQSSLEITA
jgi:membrane protein YqaA with SNARE-associated domain